MLLSQLEIAQNIYESMSARLRRARALAWVSVNKIYSSTTQKCELKHSLIEYEGVVGILLSKVEIAQIICESMPTRPRRASVPVRVSMNKINSSTTQKCEIRDALTEYD